MYDLHIHRWFIVHFEVVQTDYIVHWASDKHERRHTGWIHDGRECYPGGHRSCCRTDLQYNDTRNDNTDAHHKNAAQTRYQIGIVSRQMKLRFKIFRQKCVQSSEWQQMEHRRRSPKHKYVVAQLTFDGFWKIYKNERSNVMMLNIYDCVDQFFDLPLSWGLDSSSCFSNFFCASIARIFIGGGILLPFKCFGNVNMAIDVRIMSDEISTSPGDRKI